MKAFKIVLWIAVICVAVALVWVAVCRKDASGDENSASSENSQEIENETMGVEEADETIGGRLEVPQLSGDGDCLFIDHTVDFEGEKVSNYCLEYSVSKHHSRWVAFKAYDVTAENNVERTDAWDEDPLLPSEYYTTKTDYKGYDRGHLVASNDRRFCREANVQTFYYSNMSPQIGVFNRQIWARLEEDVKHWMTDGQLRDTLYVVKGGTIMDNQIIGFTGIHHVAVPKYYYMAILACKSGRFKGIAFWLEHKAYHSPYHLKSHTISIDELEEKTGIDFFPALPDRIETDVESQCNTDDWTWVTE